MLLLAFLHPCYFLFLVTMLLVLLFTMLVRLVIAHLACNNITYWSQNLLDNLVADLVGNRLALLLVRVLLDLDRLRISRHMAFLDRLITALLVVNRIRVDRDKVLTDLLSLSLALFLMEGLRIVIASGSGLLHALVITMVSIMTLLGAAELKRIATLLLSDNLLLSPSLAF